MIKVIFFPDTAWHQRHCHLLSSTSDVINKLSDTANFMTHWLVSILSHNLWSKWSSFQTPPDINKLSSFVWILKTLHIACHQEIALGIFKTLPHILHVIKKLSDTENSLTHVYLQGVSIAAVWVKSQHFVAVQPETHCPISYGLRVETEGTWHVSK